jgi:hypothetical protein
MTRRPDVILATTRQFDTTRPPAEIGIGLTPFNLARSDACTGVSA